MRSSNEQTLKEVLDELIESYRLKGKLTQAKVIGNWEKMMGKLIAKHTEKLYISNSCLYVYVDSAPLRQELSFNKSRIIEIINKEAGMDFIEKVIIR